MNAHTSIGHEQRAKKIACPCCDYEFVLDELGRPRSGPQLRRYMALCKRAFDNWPHDHPERPEGFTDPHECRKWLEMKAGHFAIAWDQPLDGIPEPLVKTVIEACVRSVLVTAAAQKKRSRPVAFTKVIGGKRLLIYVSQSVAFDEMTHKQFTDHCAKMDALIFKHAGIEADGGYRRALEATS